MAKRKLGIKRKTKDEEKPNTGVMVEPNAKTEVPTKRNAGDRFRPTDIIAAVVPREPDRILNDRFIGQAQIITVAYRGFMHRILRPRELGEKWENFYNSVSAFLENETSEAGDAVKKSLAELNDDLK